MIHEMLHVAEHRALGFAARIEKRYTTADFNHIEVFLGVFLQRRHSVEGPCAILPGKSLISNAKKTLEFLASHRERLVSCRRLGNCMGNTGRYTGTWKAYIDFPYLSAVGLGARFFDR